MRTIINFIMKWFQDICIFILTGVFITFPIAVCSLYLYTDSLITITTDMKYYTGILLERGSRITLLIVFTFSALFILQIVVLINWLRLNLKSLIKDKKFFHEMAIVNYSLIVLIFLYPFYYRIYELKEFDSTVLNGVRDKYFKSVIGIYLAIILLSVLRDFKNKTLVGRSLNEDINRSL